MTDERTFESAAVAAQALAENADRLGLTWSMRPAEVISYDFATRKALAVYDGDDEAISMTTLCGDMLPGFRVMGLAVPPAANFAIGYLNVPPPGTLVIRLRVTGNQSIADAGSGAFVEWGSVEHNWFDGGWSSGEPTKYQPPFPGWYFFNGRAVWTSNATSRRAALLNLNGTTAAPGTFGGQSLQTPATGSCQIQATGSVYLNGTTDYVGLRVIQNSGAPLSIVSSTDGGSVLEGYYVGAILPRSQT